MTTLSRAAFRRLMLAIAGIFVLGGCAATFERLKDNGMANVVSADHMAAESYALIERKIKCQEN